MRRLAVLDERAVLPAPQELCGAEVGELDPPRRVEEDVFRLHVTVYNAAVVHPCDGIDNLCNVIPRAAERERAELADKGLQVAVRFEGGDKV